jgi:hypothetical protein
MAAKTTLTEEESELLVEIVSQRRAQEGMLSGPLGRACLIFVATHLLVVSIAVLLFGVG